MNGVESQEIEKLHSRLAALEERVGSRGTILTGVQGIRIMRIVSLMSGNPFRYELARFKGTGNG